MANMSADRKAGGVRRWVLLARVPAAFHQAEEPRRLLAEKDRRQPDPRPPRRPHPPQARLERSSHLGTRVEQEERGSSAPQIGFVSGTERVSAEMATRLAEFRVPSSGFRVEDSNPPRRNRRGYISRFAPLRVLRGLKSPPVFVWFRVFRGPTITFRVPCFAFRVSRA